MLTPPAAENSAGGTRTPVEQAEMTEVTSRRVFATHWVSGDRLLEGPLRSD